MLIMHLSKVIGALYSLNNILLKVKVPKRQVKVVFSGSSKAILISNILNSHLESKKFYTLLLYLEPGLKILKENDLSLVPGSTSGSLWT